ncbi:hypothetical protein J2W25_002167 [Variovorax boronicumulans]|uniref:Uncharacterized protein n=1 Tax=Variovorax boronicumulans TaxID=436515 RepID=A0AAW8DV65_9BURK|nr:hypothetical protein [Variovorax boronicumulans]MDP9877862.1 hypothetical protein [Variovorax boronicumulans]MDP9923146.1 hypothetical protein [Variovorax boronicumulans]
MRVARPVDLVEPAEIAESGVVDQDVGRAPDARGGVSQRTRSIELAKICGDDLNLHALAGCCDRIENSRRRAVSTRSTPSAASSRAIAAPVPLAALVASVRFLMRAVVHERKVVLLVTRRGTKVKAMVGLARRPCDGWNRPGNGLIGDASAYMRGSYAICTTTLPLARPLST